MNTPISDGSNDGTHFQEMGAVEMARLVIEGLEIINSAPIWPILSAAYCHAITSALPAQWPTAVNSTRSARYPAGTPITLKYPAEGNNKFTQWDPKRPNVIANSALTQFVAEK